MSRFIIKIILLAFILLTGCSTVSWIANPPPDASDLLYTEKDIDKKIEELSKPPADPDAVLYNETTDRYEVKSGTYKKLITKGIIGEVLEEKTKEFIGEYEKPTLWGAIRNDLGSMSLMMLILSVAAGFAF